MFPDKPRGKYTITLTHGNINDGAFWQSGLAKGNSEKLVMLPFPKSRKEIPHDTARGNHVFGEYVFL